MFYDVWREHDSFDVIVRTNFLYKTSYDKDYRVLYIVGKLFCYLMLVLQITA